MALTMRSITRQEIVADPVAIFLLVCLHCFNAGRFGHVVAASKTTVDYEARILLTCDTCDAQIPLAVDGA